MNGAGERPPPLPAGLKLAAGEVHVVLLATAGGAMPAGRREYLEGVLSAEEREKIARLRAAEKRAEAVMSRGGLRHIVGGLLGVAPEALVLRTGEHGKPMLESAGESGALHFNVAHTEELVVVAVALDREVGVDVERVREVEGREGIARRFFSEGECAAIEALPESERLRSFFRVWTRKEAVLKGIGEGIAAGLGRVVVPVGEVTGAVMVQGWEVRELEGGAGFIGALACRGNAAAVRYWTY